MGEIICASSPMRSPKADWQRVSLLYTTPVPAPLLSGVKKEKWEAGVWEKHTNGSGGGFFSRLPQVFMIGFVLHLSPQWAPKAAHNWRFVC